MKVTDRVRQVRTKDVSSCFPYSIKAQEQTKGKGTEGREEMWNLDGSMFHAISYCQNIDLEHMFGPSWGGAQEGPLDTQLVSLTLRPFKLAQPAWHVHHNSLMAVEYQLHTSCIPVANSVANPSCKPQAYRRKHP